MIRFALSPQQSAANCLAAIRQQLAEIFTDGSRVSIRAAANMIVAETDSKESVRAIKGRLERWTDPKSTASIDMKSLAETLAAWESAGFDGYEIAIVKKED